METKERDYIPRARSTDLVFQSVENELLVYDLQRHRAHALNRTAGLVLEKCDGNMRVSDISQALSEQLSTRVGEEVVWLALTRLGRARLLDSAPPVLAQSGFARRDALRKLAMATALALPVVTSLVTPAAATLGSCVGRTCSTNADCTCSAVDVMGMVVATTCMGGMCST